MFVSVIGTFNLFGWEIKTPKEYLFDKLKTSLVDKFIDYLFVSPIVIVVSLGVYMLVGMFSKSLAKKCVYIVFFYSVLVFLFA